jgi:hypothetical protein
MYKQSKIRQTAGSGKRMLTMPPENDREKVSGPGDTGKGQATIASSIRQGPMGKKRKVPSA